MRVTLALSAIRVTVGRMPRSPSPNDPQWGPARTYRARPGLNKGPDLGTGVPLDDIDENDLVDADGHRLSSGGYREPVSYSRESYEDYDDYDEPTYQPAYGQPEHGQGYGDYPDDYDEPSQPSTYGRARSRPLPKRRPKTGRRRRPSLRLLVLLLIVIVIGYPVALGLTAMNKLHRVDALPGSPDTPGRNYLVVGSDSRSGTDLEAVSSTRTDTIMLLHVPRFGPTVMMSIPRDSDVDIPGHGTNKINAAYAIGGPKLLTETVEESVGVHIDGYVETGLAGFGAIVDAEGGITICPTFAMKDDFSGLDVQPGCQPADGRIALAYARARHSDPRGDLGRVARQREVLAQIAKQAASPRVLLNPFSAFPLARAGGNALTVDEQMGMIQLSFFLYGMQKSASGNGLSLTVPIASTDRMTSHGQVVDWDKDQSRIVFNALRDSSTEAIRPIAEKQAAEAGG